MKIDRLIGILSVLLQKGSVTAPELAEMFEVSRRTINRDIEDLCMAGIPVATRQGSGGGISILDGYTLQDCPDKTSVCKTGASGGYKLGRTVLSKTEMKDIIKTKGGNNATVLVGTVDYEKLRDFQLKEYNLQKMNKEYKPTPPLFDKEIVKLKIQGKLEGRLNR